MVRDSFLTDQAAKVEVGHTLRRQAYYSTKTGTRQRSRHNSNWRRTVVEKARVWQCPELDEGCLLMPYASDEREIFNAILTEIMCATENAKSQMYKMLYIVVYIDKSYNSYLNTYYKCI